MSLANIWPAFNQGKKLAVLDVGSRVFAKYIAIFVALNGYNSGFDQYNLKSLIPSLQAKLQYA